MRVSIVPEYPMSLMTGGLQVQAVETCKALNSVGVSAELFQWSEGEALCDLYHFIGFPDYLHRVAELLQQAKRPYVITLLMGNPNPREIKTARLRRLLRARLLGAKARDRAIVQAALIVTITKADARAAEVIFNVNASRIEVVPNGVADGFFRCTPDIWQKTHGMNGFVLCVGALQPRKNQLLLAEVCNRLKLPLTLLGPPLPGEALYAQQVERAMRENEAFGGRWLKHLRNEDELLLSAHAACRVFALLSGAETQPLSVMQAMAARKPILLFDADYAKDPLFRNLPRVDSRDVSAVCKALDEVWQERRPTELPPTYSWRSVAEQLRGLYCRIPNFK